MRDCPGPLLACGSDQARQVGLDSDTRLQPITRSFGLDLRGASAIVPADGAHTHFGGLITGQMLVQYMSHQLVRHLRKAWIAGLSTERCSLGPWPGSG